MRGDPDPAEKKGNQGLCRRRRYIDMLVLAENMAWVMGCDPAFQVHEETMWRS